MVCNRKSNGKVVLAVGFFLAREEGVLRTKNHLSPSSGRVVGPLDTCFLNKIIILPRRIKITIPFDDARPPAQNVTNLFGIPRMQ